MELREYLQVSTDSRMSDRLKLLFFRDQLACDEFAQLWSLAEEIDGEDEALLLRGLAANERASQRGIVKPRGRGLGYRLWRQAPEEDLLWMVRAFTAAALDFHFAGGDGNFMAAGGCPVQGLLASLPVGVLGKGLGRGERELAEALALSQLVTGALLPDSGDEPGFDGLVAASAGAAAGMTRLGDGSPKAAEEAVATLVAAVLGSPEGSEPSMWQYVGSCLAGQAFMASQLALSGQGLSLRFGETRCLLGDWVKRQREELL